MGVIHGWLNLTSADILKSVNSPSNAPNTQSVTRIGELAAIGQRASLLRSSPRIYPFMEKLPKVGQIVILNSGGPRMTVESIGFMWFVGKKLESGHFPPASLVVPEEDQDPSMVFGVQQDDDGPRL